MTKASASLLALLCACSSQPAQEAEPAVEAIPKLDLEGLIGAPLAELQAQRELLEGRHDLSAIDKRRALELAWLNRSPEQVSQDISALQASEREAELALRSAWRDEHVAWSWDNLDPYAQMEPRPERTCLAWLALATRLPLARNGFRFEQAWVSDYFLRKAWYRPSDGPYRMSFLDRAQVERAEKELQDLAPDALQSHLAALPAPRMSAAEAHIEAWLAGRLLAGEELWEQQP